MSDKGKDFVNGLIAKAPRDGAPSFLKCTLSIKRTDLIAWLQAKEGDWINVDVKESKGGKWYAAVNDWKPTVNPDRAKAETSKHNRDESPF